MKIGDECKVGETTYELVRAREQTLLACSGCAGRFRKKDGDLLCGELAGCIVNSPTGNRIMGTWIRKKES